MKSLVYIEIDAPRCSLTYGTSPCTASIGTTGDRKCFNSIATCQDRANFDDDPVTMRFAKPALYRPADIPVLAASLVSVDVTPGRISLGEDLGQRATLTAVFRDHPWSDTGPGGDPYLADRAYNPYRQGTFFGKFRVRQKYLRGAPLRYIRGELGQAIEDMEVRHYFVDSIDGPMPDGTFRIVAKDLLKFADNDRAMAPVPNNGYLLSAITETDTVATLAPSGIGALEYLAVSGGYFAIGGTEIVQGLLDAGAGNDANARLLLHFDGASGSTTITDSSSNAHVVTANADAKLNTGNKKFGTASLILDGTGDYLSVPDSAQWTFSGDFTIEMWIRPDSVSGNMELISHATDANNHWRLRVTSGGALQWVVTSAAVNIVSMVSSNSLITAGGSFRHIAVVRNGNSWAIYLDGVSVATTTDSDAIPNFAGPLLIGCGFGTTNPFVGRIDELRISNVARWTAGFSPPVAPYLSSTDQIYLVRAQRDTIAATHEADDLVQVGLEYVAQSAADIAYDLLVNYAAVDAGYIPLANWQTEITTYLGVLHTRRIYTPTGVRELLSDLIREAALAMWWDDLTPQLRLMVLRAVGAGAGRLDEGNVLTGSFSQREQPEKRVSEVQVRYGLRNPLLALDDPASYRSLHVVTNLQAATDYGSPAIVQINARWIPPFGDSIAEELGLRILSRYVHPPRRFSLSTLRGADEVVLGDGYEVGWWTLQDDTGAPVYVPAQAIEVATLEDRFNAVLEEVISDEEAVEAELNRVITIDSDINNVNLLTLYETIYPSPTTGDVSDGVTVRFVVAEGVTVGSTSRSNAALRTGSWPTGFVPVLEVNGRIQGAGGRGGKVPSSIGNGGAGQDGGIALQVDDPIELEGTGEIWGGGGGGGAAGLAEGGGSGGGGAGTVPGAAGALGGMGSVAGEAGTTEAGGDGGELAPGVDGGAGGDGGAPGQAGTDGGDEGAILGGDGGDPGDAVSGWSDVTDNSSIDFEGPQTG